MTAIRWALRGLQTVSPSLTAGVAERIFFTPPRSPRAIPLALRPLFAGARPFEVELERRRIAGWRWGSGPLVYLVHGWGSRAARVAGLAAPLVDAGCSVVAFDAPGHGASSRGMSSIPEFARALIALAEREGRPHAVVAHSLGAAATSVAVSWGLTARRLVFLAPPASPVDWVTAFATRLGLTAGVVARLQARSERRLRMRWGELDLTRAAGRMAVPLLVVHDELDERVPWRDGSRIAAAWPGARLLTTRGLGHGGVVRAPDVVEQVVAFAAAQDAGSGWGSDSERLEAELFHRDLRWASVEGDPILVAGQPLVERL